MVRQARAMIADGSLGEIRQVHVEYSQGQLSSYVEPDAPERLKWRLDPERVAGSRPCSAISAPMPISWSPISPACRSPEAER